MKTIPYNKLFSIALLSAIIIIASSIEVNAQRRESSSGERQSIRKYQPQKDTRNSRSTREMRTPNRKYKYSQPERMQQNSENPRRHNDYTWHRERENRNKPIYRKHNTPQRYRDQHRSLYMHPQYGRTYKKLHHSPYIFKYNQGNYYYYNGYFCNYRPGVGYVIMDAPYSTVFFDLPFQCQRVFVHGNTYYQYGNLYFEPLVHGYRLVPAPIQIHISASF